MTRARATDPWTSHDAGASVEPILGKLHRLVLATLHDNGPMTAEECCDAAGVPSLWRRFSELEKRGLIEPTGEDRPTRSGRRARVFRFVRPKPVQCVLFEAMR